MAKKKKRTKSPSSKKKQQAPEHALPSGFWAQVGAVVMLALAALLVVAWFGAGGPVIDWLNQSGLNTIGYAIYILPLLLVFLALEIFRSENNKLSLVMKLAAVLLIAEVAGLSGLFTNGSGQSTGGFVGDTANSAMLALVDSGVAVFIYVLLIVITLLFVLRISPKSIFDAFAAAVRTESKTQQDQNVKVMREAAKPGVDDDIPGFGINAGVPIATGRPGKGSKPADKPDKPAEPQSALVTVHDPNWQAPSLELLENKQNPADAGDIEHNAAIIRDTLREFAIDVKMEGANIGPKVTQYTLSPPSGVKLARISALETNLALNLAASALRIEAPIPGKRAVGIEVPNQRAADVRIRGILESKLWSNSREPLSFAVGKDISGEPVIGELNKMPHLLIAGQTNSGKSVMINTLLCSLLYRNSPSKMKLILVDPKQVEMARYKDIPHLLAPIITEPDKTVSALKWAVNEMERRYNLLAEVGELNIADYNNHISQPKRGKKIEVTDDTEHEAPAGEGEMPYIVVVIDEMADLMMVASRDVESLVVRLAQKARAVGIHLVLATQSPRADVITGLIKANIPAKIAFTVGNQVESRIILDQVGAEKLLGQGDMLYKTATMNKPMRVQGAWVMNNEVKKVADHLRMQAPPQYNDEIISQPVQLNGKGGVVMDMEGGGDDSMFRDAVRVVTETRKASTSLLQRKLRIGYARAARIIEEMEEKGIIGPPDGSRPRDVLISSVDDIDGTANSDDDSQAA